MSRQPRRVGSAARGAFLDAAALQFRRDADEPRLRQIEPVDEVVDEANGITFFVAQCHRSRFRCRQRLRLN